LNDGWQRLDRNIALEEVARTYLTALRLLSPGHLYAEPALLLLVAIFDALGTSKHSVTEAMTRSYARHYCPELRAHAEDSANLLFDLTYHPGRNPVGHEARQLHLAGHGSGPLGDKPRDLDPTVGRIDFAVINALATQARFLLRGELGAPNPEPGKCIHSA
jgi:hypothetical protein